MNHWVFWFNDYIDSVIDYDTNDGINRIIMFKSCYPISNIKSDGSEPGNPFDAAYPNGQSISNYKAVYRHPDGSGNTYFHNSYTYKPLEDVFAEYPDKLFIPVTAPPRHYAPSDATNDDEASRARDFNNWLKNDWLTDYNIENPELNNVFVFDWFDVLAYPDDHPNHPNRLKKMYGGNSGDSHPNYDGNIDSTELFATNVDSFLDVAWDLFYEDTGDNSLPNTPSNPNPADDSKNVSINTMLSWRGGDPDGDSVKYDVYFGLEDSIELVSENQSGKTYDPYDLDFKTTYYWYIVAWDEHGLFSEGQIWYFTIQTKSSSVILDDENNNPIADASAGEPYRGYTYQNITFDASQSYDPDFDDSIGYEWDFGDGNKGSGMIINHSYQKHGKYIVNLTVIDEYGATDSYETPVVVIQSNNPPSKPMIGGTSSGTIDTMYYFDVESFDLDDDTIQYSIDWGDQNISIIEFIIYSIIITIYYISNIS